MAKVVNKDYLAQMIKDNAEFKMKVSVEDAKWIIEHVKPCESFMKYHPKDVSFYLFFYGGSELTHTSLKNQSTFDASPFEEIELDDDIFMSQQELWKYLVDGGKVVWYGDESRYYSFVDGKLELSTGGIVTHPLANFSSFGKYKVKELTLNDIEKLLGYEFNLID